MFWGDNGRANADGSGQANAGGDDIAMSTAKVQAAQGEVSRRRFLATAGAAGAAGALSGMLATGGGTAEASVSEEVFVNVKDYGAVGNGSVDDSVAIQKALDAVEEAGGGTVAFPPGTYIAVNLTIGNGVGISGSGGVVLKLKASSSKHLLTLSGDGAVVKDIIIDGNGENQPSQDNSLLWVTGNNAQIVQTTFRKVFHVAINVTIESTRAMITRCTFEGEAPTSPAYSSRNCIEVQGGFASVLGNSFRDVDKGHGVRVGLDDDDLPGPPFVEHVVVADNIFINIDVESENESPAMKSEAASRHVIFANNCVKGGQRSLKLDNCSDVVVVGNTMDGCTSPEGINASVAPRLIFANNLIRGCGGGLYAPSDALVVGNYLENIGIGNETKTSGGIIGFSTSPRLLVAGNVLKNVARRAIETVASQSRVIDNYIEGGVMAKDTPVMRVGMSSAVGCEARGNTIVDPESAGGTSIAISAWGKQIRVQSNSILTSSPVARGISLTYVYDGVVRDNIIRTASTPIYREGGGASVLINGNVGATQLSVASTGTISLPGSRSVKVTGTTTITNITAALTDAIVTLVFASSLKVSDGGNLRLASDFNATSDDTLTLMCDGTNWYEIARSVN